MRSMTVEISRDLRAMQENTLSSRMSTKQLQPHTENTPAELNHLYDHSHAFNFRALEMITCS